jgi:hypothetical protein
MITGLGCDFASAPYRYSVSFEDGRRVDVPPGGDFLFLFDGTALVMRVIDETGMVDHPCASADVQVRDAAR